MPGVPEHKVKVTVEVEPEVIEWFKAQGENYERFPNFSRGSSALSLCQQVRCTSKDQMDDTQDIGLYVAKKTRPRGGEQWKAK
jgi:hypothetical protein